ncbi:MAG: transporter [Sphingomonadaceae bacterium]|nr:transporter [Sphingomonadaceae bacterium]
MLLRVAAMIALALATAPAAAQSTNAEGQAVLPSESAADSPICTDRPTRSNFACTVPKGLFQIESDVASWTRIDVGGVRGDAIVPVNPVIKYGVGTATDVEVNWAPYVRLRGRAFGTATVLDGVGDVTLRLKQRFTDPSKPVQFSLIPYVKAPTARLGIGNGEWEGGVIAPVNISIAKSFTLTIVPQGDVAADVLNPSARHGRFVGLINLGYQMTPKVTFYTELWTSQDFDPSGTIRQYSFDFAVTRLVNNNTQLDFGGNFGLNSNTPDAQLYLGISTRF